jgi:hypothetical protein
MNDFSEIEDELRKLRPVRPSQQLFERVAGQLESSATAAEPTDNIIRPARFNFGWISLGLGLAAAAAFVLLARMNQPTAEPAKVASAPTTPLPAQQLNTFIPAGASRVVYHTRDEGLLFPPGSDDPVRRVRSRARETLQWHNPKTGASLRVSYPSEEVQLIPVAGQ